MFAVCESTRKRLKSEISTWRFPDDEIQSNKRERGIFHPNEGKTETDFPISRIWIFHVSCLTNGNVGRIKNGKKEKREILRFEVSNYFHFISAIYILH